MKIIVCVKQVARITIQNGFDPNTKDIVSEGLVHILNPYDEIATEEAIRLKEKADEAKEKGKSYWWRWLDRFASYYDRKYDPDWRDKP